MSMDDARLDFLRLTINRATSLEALVAEGELRLSDIVWLIQQAESNTIDGGET